jgi:5-deoxy-glucuronate isomerase
MTVDWYLPAGTYAEPPYSLVLTPERAGWSYAGLRVLDLPEDGRVELATGGEEMLVLPLSGSCEVECDGERFALAGRDGVFDGPSDFAYLPRDSEAAVSTQDGGRFALPSAPARRRLPARYRSAADVAVELRGAGAASRQVNNFCSPEAFACDRLCAVEVLTPGGNWSSYPPHKHDEDRPGEAVLEEIYYFEVAGHAGSPGFGYQRVYGPPGRPIDVLAEVRSGDVVLVPHGYHGPSVAAPGYDLYYLNVLAGPGEQRSMAFQDDPAHAWVRRSWPDVPVDPRLPFRTGSGSGFGFGFGTGGAR